ncbi:hypothetical protein [Chitiniphilus eburneus]|uniref:Lipoprotein n=1 Tax=Chitiniphilus eburneus TaxID=2571148 RepID=A0A4U0PZF6_9NEIS|nr:hypothetical protein [Chitiniphilus eburneus]TJZ74073.1 hypothetical protein FAZ21_08950 [Chitiniphilus eburneus]
MKKLLALIATLSLLGCGGGGDDGSGSDGGFSVSTSTRSLSFSYYAGEETSPQLIVVTGNGTPSSDVYVGGGWDGDGLRTVEYDLAGNAASFYVKPEANLEPGTHSGTIVLLACKDANCTSHHNGSPIKVPYSIEVLPGIQTLPASLELVGVLGDTLHGEFDITLPAGAYLVGAWAYGYLRNLQQSGNHFSVDIYTGNNVTYVQLPGVYEDTIEISARTIDGKLLSKLYKVKYELTRAPLQDNFPIADPVASNVQSSGTQVEIPRRTVIKKWIAAGSNSQ